MRIFILFPNAGRTESFIANQGGEISPQNLSNFGHNSVATVAEVDADLTPKSVGLSEAEVFAWTRKGLMNLCGATDAALNEEELFG